MFYAPWGTNFQTVLQAGENNSYGMNGVYQYVQMNNDIGHYGQFDFQRNFGMGNQSVNFFFTQYTNASNFAVGVYGYGTGRSLGSTLQLAQGFAQLFSSNVGDPWQQFYQILGYTTAMFGFPPGFGCMDSNPLDSPLILQLNLNSPTIPSSSSSGSGPD